MKNIAVITEYNPFHKGHAVQIEKIKELFGDDARIIAIMSGNTVQRGETALYDKYTRAEAALQSGVSAVFEIPFPYSSSPAEIFASAGVHIAEGLGNIDHLVFGSETGDIKKLEIMSGRISSEEYLASLAEYSNANKDIPYPKRRAQVYKALYGEDLAISANDILGVEYISALRKMKSRIVPVTYKREEGFSAGKTRNDIRQRGESEGLSEECLAIFSNAPISDNKKLFSQLFGCLVRCGADELLGVFDMPCDLANKMKTEAALCADHAELMAALKGSGYTDARIRREMLYLWCGVEKIEGMPKYTNLLGFDEKGREYIKEIKRTKRIQILTKPADFDKMQEGAAQAYENALMADRLFAMCLEKPIPFSDIMKKGPVIKKN